MAGYTRNDTGNNIADGNIINASDLDGEFDAVEAAFNSSTGHTHDGTSAEGAPIEKVGPVQDLVITATEVKPKTNDTLDLGTSLLKFKDLFIDGDATLGGVIVDNDGTIGSVSDTDAIAISSGGVVTFSQAPVINVENATTNAVTDVLTLRTQSTGTPAVGIGAGMLFSTETAAGTLETGGAIRIVTTGLTPTDEEIDLVFYSMRNGSLTEAFRYDSAQDRLEITGGASVTADVNFGDNDKAIFGAGSDLEIYHDGSHSIIKDVGSGNLYIGGAGSVALTNTAVDEFMLRADQNGTVVLYYDNSAKLSTTNIGIDVTGTVAADGLSVVGNSGTGQVVVANATAGSIASPQFTDVLFTGFVGRDKARIRGVDINSSSAGGELLFETSDSNSTDQSSFATRMKISRIGDISFYEDTGTNARIFYDADTQLVVNEDGADFDFRVASDGNTHAIFVDANLNAVGINNSSPSHSLHAKGSSFQFESTGIQDFNIVGDPPEFNIYDSGGSTDARRFRIAVNGDITQIQITNDADTSVQQEFLNFGMTDGRVIVNELGNDADFRVESDGNAYMLFVDASTSHLGIGESSPAELIHATQNGGDAVLLIENTGSSSSDDANIQLKTENGSTFTLQNDRSLGTAGRFTIAGDVSSFALDHADGSLETNPAAGGTTVFNESGADSDFRVESDGDANMFVLDASADAVGIARPDPFHYLDIYTAGSSRYGMRVRSDRAAGQNFITFDYGAGNLGAITGNGSVLTYGGTSDHRLKTNVQALYGSIDRVKSLNPVTFDWIASGLSAEGFIAHELQSVVPTAVTGEHNEVDDEGSPVYQQVDPRNVVPLLTSALQEAIAKIESLEARVATLEAN